MDKVTFRPEIPDSIAEELSRYPKLMRELLYGRDIHTRKDAERFLNPSYDLHTHDPFLMKGMEKAVDRVLRSIRNNEKILIYSDYDADGIPGGVTLHDFFKKIGFLNFENYFPHRYEEGYGVHKAAVEKCFEREVKLIITIDCGTADIEAITRANELGIDVIVTDHHLSQEAKLPPAFAILNPKQSDCTYPYRMLCGSGVIFKFIQAILKKDNFGLKEGMEKWFLDMVGLATIADMVPLRDENRVFAYYGLKVLQKSPRLGLIKLLKKSKVNQQFLSEEDIGFMIAPRINAASRMGKPSEAFELLTANEEAHAEMMSTYLNKINDERKGAAAAISKEVKKIFLERKELGKDHAVIVIGNPHWKPALLGPVANTIMEAHGKPVFMWGRADGVEIKGSCRSIGGINLIDLMKAVPEGIFLAYGGHKMAGGFSVSHEKFHLLEEELNKAFLTLEKVDEGEDRGLCVDGKLGLDEVQWDTYGMIEKLGPFGLDNSRPQFLFENVEITEVKRFGKEKNHLELVFMNSKGKKIPAIGFFVTEEDFSTPVMRGEKINLVATLEKSMFRNYPELRLRIVDII